MLALFRQFVGEQKLISPNDKVLVAVSGGVDSMVLLDLLKKSDIELGIAHCNFQLRGEESDRDEKFVCEVGEELGIRTFVKSFDTKGFAVSNGVSTQMAARELRYQWFGQIMKEHGFTKLATAHHKNDRFETALYNLTKGTGIKGLVPFSVGKEEAIIRPLMFATRENVEDYAKAMDLRWREDASNQSTEYHRNRLRLNVIPELLEINPSLFETYQNTNTRFEETEKVLDDYINLFKTSSFKQEGEELAVSLVDLTLSMAPTSILYDILKPKGFNYSQCLEIYNGLDSQSGKRFLSETTVVLIDREHLRIFPLEKSEGFEILIGKEEKEINVGRGRLSLEFDQPTEISKDPFIAEVDAENLLFPLIVRNFREGDRFRPLGMDQSKKISDFLIDEKVPLNKKHLVPIVFSGEEVVWIAGYRIDNRYKVKDSTNKILRLKYEED